MINEQRQQPTGTTGARGPSYAEKVGEQHRWAAEQEREEKMTKEKYEHEILLKKMDIDARTSEGLAEAMSKERIAGVGAEAGTEQARIGAAGQVGAAQKTSMEKGYEFVDMLMQMDKAGADELISSLLAKEAGQAKERPLSTITSGGRTVTLPGALEEAVGDPNNPLTWMREIGFDPEAGAPRPKVTGKPANEVEELMDLVDDYIGGNLVEMADMFSKPGGTDKLMSRIDTLGTEAGFSTEAIDSVKEIYRAMSGPREEDVGEEGGGLGGAIKNILTPGGLGREELPSEATAGSEAYLEGAGAFKEGAPLAEKEPGFARTLEDFIETTIAGPFSEKYKEYRGKRRGIAEPVGTVEPTPTKEEGELTEQDVITEMSTWDKDKIKEFQRIAKKAGLYKGEINGLISHTLEDAMKKYYKDHKEEWGE
jgi:hypothetical protein